MKRIYLDEILSALGSDVHKVHGDLKDVFIDNMADQDHVTETTLDWVKESNPRRQHVVESSNAKIIIVGKSIEYSEELKKQGKVLIVVDEPRNAIARIGNEFFVQRPVWGIHPTAIIDHEAEIAEGVSIGPFCVIGKVKIGKNTNIGSFVRIYDSSEIGSNCNIADHVVLGSEGFGYGKDGNGDWIKFPQIGGLTIGNNVDIGSFTTIDRGALSVTKIGDNTKIDSKCKIAHNVVVGENVVFTGGSGAGGSCVIGDNVWVGSAAKIKDWVKIGEGAFLGIGSVVIRNVKPNTKVFGNPAKELDF